MLKSCDTCGKETENPRFCSRSCAARKTNAESPKRKLTKKCTKCSLIVKSHRHTLCETHWDEYKQRFRQDMTIGEYRNKQSVAGKHRSWIHSHVRCFARSWLTHMRKMPCAKCGYDKHVELAHIKGLSEFDDHVKLNEINSESNVIQLCPNCHWEFDNLPMTEEFKQLLVRLNKFTPDQTN